MSARRVGVLGAGKLGAAISALLVRSGHDVALWARRPKAAAKVAEGVSGTGRGLWLASSVEDACRDADVVCFAVPTPALADIARRVGDVARGDQIALHGCRGVVGPFMLPHAIIRRETCIKKIGVLGGPLYLDDAARGRPLVAVLASRFEEVHRTVKDMVTGTQVRVHASFDVTGVEVAGAVSNVAHIAAGLAAGAGLGETDQAILLNRGLVESSRIGAVLGADLRTFSGLAGVGDLIPRPVTSTRRHRKLGEEIGAGRAVAEVLEEVSELEGVVTAQQARALAERIPLGLPLLQLVHDVLFAAASPAAALERVLGMDFDLDVAA